MEHLQPTEKDHNSDATAGFPKSDAVTYNHMEEEQGFKTRYITRNSILPVWPLVFEELVIAALALFLLITCI